MSDYWDRRKSLSYYRIAFMEVVTTCLELNTGFPTLLDIGSGVQYGTEYLSWFRDIGDPHFEYITSLEDKDNSKRPHFVDEYLFHDFTTYQESDRVWDCVMCLQALEHMKDPEECARKILKMAKKFAVVSLPFQWPKNKCKSHLHDPIGMGKIQRWFGREATRHYLVDSRVVLVYEK